MFLPKARTENIVVQSVGKELLVYDLRTNKAYNLNETSRIIFELCDGKTSFDELSRKHKFPNDLIHFALDEFDRLDLMKGEYRSKFVDVSRREVIRRVGLASMLALPVIVSITAPKAVQAQSLLPLLATCALSSQCASGSCGNAIGGGANCCINPPDSGCSSNAQCCQAGGGAGSSCIAGACCANNGAICATDARCCSGFCNLGTGQCA